MLLFFFGVANLTPSSPSCRFTREGGCQATVERLSKSVQHAAMYEGSEAATLFAASRHRVIDGISAAIEDIGLARYVDIGLSQIEGWGIDSVLSHIFICLDNVQRDMSVAGNLLEIGVHHGRTAILLALMSRQGETAVFMDLFDRQEENLSASGAGDRAIFERSLETWAPLKRVSIIEANSLSCDFAENEHIASGIRFAHIDGGHDKATVLNDLRKTEAHLVEGGLIVVDDFWHSGFPEVNEACHEYLTAEARGKVAPVATGRNKLVLASASRSAAYLDLLRARISTPRGKLVRCYGHEAVCLDTH